MSGLINLLGSDLGKSLIEGLSSQTGQSKSNTTHLLNMALPVLVQAMQRNASTPQGASGLLEALNGKHDGSILNNLSQILSGTNVGDLAQDGGKILGHILGSRQHNVQNALSRQSGINPTAVSQILKITAPVLMGFLGKQQRQSTVKDANGLTNLLGGLMGGNFQNKNQSLIESILDADQDGSILDDVAGAVIGKKKSGLGSLLGKLFNKK